MLNRPAPFGGARVTVEARRRNIVTVLDAVVVPEGASVASFSIATDTLHAAREKSVEIVVTYNNVSASATLTVLPTAQATSSHKPSALCASLVLVPCVTQSTVRAIKPLGGQGDGPPPSTTPTLFEQQYTFYTPELNLMSETTSTSTAATPVIAYDYVWFGGQPLAQIENATGNIAWYVNDHLGTPIRQTDDTGRVLWQAEYEPYGTIFAIRRGEARHQPLRLPGQTAEEGSDLYQNVFRFYMAGWGRYTQADPIDLEGGINLYAYAAQGPLRFADPTGLDTVGCDSIPAWLRTAARWTAARRMTSVMTIIIAQQALGVTSRNAVVMRQRNARSATPTLRSVSRNASFQLLGGQTTTRDFIALRNINSFGFHGITPIEQQQRKLVRKITAKTAKSL